VRVGVTEWGSRDLAGTTHPRVCSRRKRKADMTWAVVLRLSGSVVHQTTAG